MERLYREDQVRAIGVSNFLSHHLETLLEKAEIIPAVNQIEFHPFNLQPGLLEYCDRHSIQVEAWSPLVRGRLLPAGSAERARHPYRGTANRRLGQ